VPEVRGHPARRRQDRVAGSILNKPDRLTASEFDSIKAHAVIGENIVKDVDFLQPIRP